MRVDALDKPGGDVEHMRTYIRGCEALARKQGDEFAGEILTELNPELEDFDLVHLTNLDRPVDLYSHYLAAKRAGKPIVLTPLHHSYREIERYEREARGGGIGLVSGRLGFAQLEAGRIAIRSRRYPELRAALWRALRPGIRAAQIEVLRGCDRVLTITAKETADIAKELIPLPDKQVVMLKNGYEATPVVAHTGRDISIAVVARVEARKNQIAILDAVETLGFQATFVGPENVNHGRYCAEFRRRIAASASTYVPGVPQAEVAGLLARSQVHVSASWFEVSSLVDIDAYAQGCRVVASHCGGTQELLGSDAAYVDPGSGESIRAGIAAAVESVRQNRRNAMTEFLQRVPTWEDTCMRLSDLYNSLREKATYRSDSERTP